MLEIKTYPDPCLRIKTRPVEVFDEKLSVVIKEMTDIMYLNQGVGLAAPQVGLGLDIVVMDAGDELIPLINPEILELSGKKTGLVEGCLSLPGLSVNVKRSESVKVRAQDSKGNFFIKKFTDLSAKVAQHEIDHLRGRMIVDYLDPVRKFFAKRKLAVARQDGKKECEVVCNVRKNNK